MSPIESRYCVFYLIFVVQAEMHDAVRPFVQREIYIMLIPVHVSKSSESSFQFAGQKILSGA